MVIPKAGGRLPSRAWPERGHVSVLTVGLPLAQPCFSVSEQILPPGTSLICPVRLQKSEQANRLRFRLPSSPESSGSRTLALPLLHSCVRGFLGARRPLDSVVRQLIPKVLLYIFFEQSRKQYWNVGNFQFYKHMQTQHDDGHFCYLNLLN